MKIEIEERIERIPAAAWNRLVQGNDPFLRHEFLQAMEQHGCVGEVFGWLPRHIALYEAGELVGAMPLYEKQNSYGEFVFDHAWADAWRRAGANYYPKLVSAIPYTPATGQRLLAAPGRSAEIWPLLLDTARELSRQLGASGFHCLFPVPEEHRFLAGQGLVSRHDCQFHWRNRDYRDFEAFLSRLTAKKRKNIRQERRKVERSGVLLRRLDGHQATAREWRLFTGFYNQTFAEKWGIATFNCPFFLEVARAMPDQVLLVLAEQEGECIAGSLMYCSDTTLYGRHWGCSEHLDSLHFEACYYQGIEYCIERGLERFEPGAQGEHKMARGFLPTITRSCHWLVDSRFLTAVTAFARHEREAVIEYMDQLGRSTPYRKEDEY